MTEPTANPVCGATAAEDWSSEIIFENIARPVSREHATRENTPAIADQPRHIASVVAGKTRVEPLDPFFGDGRVGKRKRCIPTILGATRSARIAHMRREHPGYIGIFDVVVAHAWC